MQVTARAVATSCLLTLADVPLRGQTEPNGTATSAPPGTFVGVIYTKYREEG